MADAGPSAPRAPEDGALPLLGLDTDKLHRLKKNAGNLVNKDDPKQDLQPDGLYCLDLLRGMREEPFADALPSTTCDSYLLLMRGFGVYEGLKEDLSAMIESMEDRAKTPNPMNSKTYVRRRQCTYGADYAFSNQEFDRLALDDEAPGLVQYAVEAVRTLVARLSRDGVIRGVKPEDYNGVHCNWYGEGDVEIGAHQDDERGMLEGAPIFSLTFLAKKTDALPQEALPREFEVCTPEYETDADGKPVRTNKGKLKKTGFKRVAGVTLAQGDLLVMGGKMQKEWYHRLVAPKPKADYKNTQRINLTVRAFDNECVEKMKARLDWERAEKAIHDAIQEAKKLAEGGKEEE